VPCFAYSNTGIEGQYLVSEPISNPSRYKTRTSGHCICTFVVPVWYSQQRVYPTSGPPSLVMRPATTCVDCAYTCTIKITQYFGLLCVQLIVIFTRGAREPSHNNGRGPCAEESSEAPLPVRCGRIWSSVRRI